MKQANTPTYADIARLNTIIGQLEAWQHHAPLSVEEDRDVNEAKSILIRVVDSLEAVCEQKEKKAISIKQASKRGVLYS